MAGHRGRCFRALRRRRDHAKETGTFFSPCPPRQKVPKVLRMFMGDPRQKLANGAALQQAIMQYVQWRASIGAPIRAAEKHT
jgi:hypothetical protein